MSRSRAISMTSLRLASSIVLGGSLLVACNSTAPNATRDSSTAATTSSGKPPADKAGGGASNKVEPKSVPRSGVPDSGKSAEPTIRPSADAPVSGVAMPDAVKRCERNKDALVGDWKPTTDEIVTAASALTEDVCLKAAIRDNAIRACAAKVEMPETIISTDDLEGPSGCEVQIGAISEGGRKFVVFFGFYRSNASTFDGGARAVELTSAGPKLYLDALGKHGSLCPTTGGDPLKPEDKPAGWSDFPQSTRDFLCKASR